MKLESVCPYQAYPLPSSTMTVGEWWKNREDESDLEDLARTRYLYKQEGIYPFLEVK